MTPVAEVNGCLFPEDLYYDLAMHVWVRFAGDGTAVLGMTDPGQTRSGKLLKVTPKKPGKRLQRGDSAAILESAKWIGPFPTPLSGEVVEANERVAARPITVNKDLYGEGWIVRLQPRDLAGEMRHLLTGETAVAAYKQWLAAENLYCIHCAE